MKTLFHIPFRRITLALALLAFLPQPTPAATPPHIRAIEVVDDQLVIAAEAPGGVVRLVLEGAERGDLRTWRPRAVQRVDHAGPVSFRLPLNLTATLRVEMFRVRADTNDPLPAAFYTGKTEFAGEPAPAGNPLLFRSNDGSEWVLGNGVPPPSTAPVTDAAPERDVAESDIWRVHGNRLYFFNQQRGLQIVDITHPDTPTLLATFPLPASGEQMYLLGEDHVALLARSQPCDTDGGQSAASAVIVIDVSGDAPRETARVPLEGRILESRLVGTALYVGTDTWSPKSDRPEDAGVWVNGTRLTGIDLAQPAQPVSRNSVWLPGSGNVVTATEQFLLVGIQTYDTGRWWDSRLHVLDIRDPAGAIREFTSLPLDGRLQDKFKVDVSDNILTAITAGPANANGSGPWRSILTTYRLADATPPDTRPSATRLGSVEVGHGEQLYATRFDGQRAYLVTFLQIDPLWIIDLSQPENPRVLGELEIPGWSTFIQPMGDRLLTVGFDNTAGLRAAVQLFDVANPAKPALLAKVPLGKEWSWSEANSDEKALGVFPQDGLVLVPFSSSSADQQVLGVQVIDLGRDTLTARGRIENKNVVPRRTTLAGDRVLALSSRDLVSVSLADRDHPEVRGRLELSYPVDRVLPVGNWLVEFSEFRLRTRAANAPGESQDQLELDSLPVLGATLHDGHILVLQGRPPETVWKNDQWITNTPAAVQLTLLNASALPALQVVGSTLETVEMSLSGDFEALWPQPGLVTWTPMAFAQPWYFRGFPEVIDLQPGRFATPTEPGIAFAEPVPPDASAPAIIPVADAARIAFWDGGFLPFWPGWNLTPPTVVAFDVRTPERPRLASLVTGPDNAFAATRAFTSDGLVYFGHDTQETRITGTNTYVSILSEPVVTRRDIQVTNHVQIPYETLITNVYSKDFSVPAWQVSSPRLNPVVAGTLHAVGVDATGTVFGWGDNRAGQLGSLVLVNSESPVQIPFPGTVTSLAAAKWFSLARLADGSVYIAGSPLGPDGPPIPGTGGTTLDNPIQQILPLPTDILDVAAGYHHAFARTASGQLHAWGLNDRGQLGTGNDLDQPTPVPLATPSPIAAVAGGGLHSLALTTDGLVLGWGDNQRFQLGASAPDRILTPQPVPGLPAAQAIAAGDFHALALDADQTVWSWGEWREGDPKAGATPRPVPGLPPIRAIAAGRYHSLATDHTGQVWSWGPHGSEPYRVTPLEPIVSISARGSFAIANGLSGQTYLWQLDEYPTPFAGSKLELRLFSNLITNVEPGILYRTETNVVTRTLVETHWVETTVTNSYPVYEYSTHHHLNVVDYALDPSQPVVRPPVALPGAFQGVSHQGALIYTLASRPEANGSTDVRSWLEALAYDGTAAHLVTSLEVANLSQSESALIEVTPDGSLWLAQSTQAGKSHQLSLLTVTDNARFETRASTPLASPPQDLNRVGDVLSASFGSTVQLFEVDSSPAIVPHGLPFDLGCLLQGLHRLAGSPDSGVWAPLGDYGSAPLP